MLAFSLKMLTYLTFLIHIIVSNVEMVDNKCCPKKTLGEKEYVLVDYDEKEAELSGCLTSCVYTEVGDFEFKRICFKEGDLFPQCDAEFDPSAPPEDRRLRSASSESKSWMKAVDGNTRLHELSIPGTHDTMAWKGPGQTIWSYTQSLTLKEQLERGVRFLDIRLNIRGGELGCYHGIYYCDNNLRGVMWYIYDFLRNNPTETVIFGFKIERDSDPSAFCPMFNDFLRPYHRWIYSYQNSGLLPPQPNYPTLNQMRGKIVIYHYYPRETAACFGLSLGKIELDNWNGKGFNPMTGREGADIVSWKWLWERKRQVTDFTNVTKNEKAEEAHKTIPENNVIETKNISTSMSENFLNTSFEEINSTTVDLTTWFNDVSKLRNEKKQRVLGSYEASDEYKNELTHFQDQVRSNSEYKPILMITYASAWDFKCHPKRLASHVNPHLYDYFGRNPTGRTGIVVFDYPTTWHHDLMKRIYTRNFKVCAQLYEHGNYEGDSFQLIGEYNDLTKIGWNDRISSIRVFPGCRLHWYGDANLKGGHRWHTHTYTYTIGWASLSGMGNTGNDKISSLKCDYE